MEKPTDQRTEALITLGTASTSTQGATGHMMEATGLWTTAGVSDD